MRKLTRVQVSVLAIVCLSASLCCTAVLAQGTKKAPKTSPEMTDFLKQLNGDEKSVNAALKKYAAEGVDVSAMEGILVEKPKVTKVVSKDDTEVYTIKCATGILERTYEIAWKEKKIQTLKQTAIK